MPTNETTTPKHSPGPWRAEEDRGGLGYLIYPPSQVSIGAVDFAADARLIAAAPEMLELLRATQELHAVVHVAGCDCAFCRRDRLLKRIDGDQP